MSFNVENYFKDLLTEDHIFSYKGDISSDVINLILDSVERKTEQAKDPSRIRKKVYNVLVESLQNLYHHVDTVPGDFEDQDSERFGIVVVNCNTSGYNIITGNFIRRDKVERLKEKLDKINESTAGEIKELYKFILHHQKISPKGGGGLGLVDIARKTGNKLNYEFYDYDRDYAFFRLSITISAQESN
ncbi:MAG: SiaB family protein kinase [Bacteroidales bacterium]|nr:SiaB family protein kinase [Bacteroidales bacterium]